MILFITIFAIILATEGMYLPFLYAIGFPAASVKLLLYLKYAMVGFLFLRFFLKVLFSKRYKIKHFELMALFLILWSAFIFGFALVTRFQLDIYRVPLFIFPLVTYFAGRALSIDYPTLVRSARIVTCLFLAQACYAIVDVLLFDAHLWRDVLQQERFLIDIKNYGGAIYRGVVGNFYFDPWVLSVRRALGTTGEPLTFAYAAVLPLMFLLVAANEIDFVKSFRRVAVAVGLAALVMSMTRAVIVAGMVCLAVRKLTKRRYNPVVFAVSALMIFVVTNAGPIITLLVGLNDSSTKGHLDSLAGIYDLSIQQLLLGVIAAQDTSMLMFESGFMNYIVTLGLLMAMVFYAFIYILLESLRRSNLPCIMAVSLCGTVGVITSFIFSEGFFTFTGYGLFWFFAGLSMSTLQRQREGVNTVTSPSAKQSGKTLTGVFRGL